MIANVYNSQISIYQILYIILYTIIIILVWLLSELEYMYNVFFHHHPSMQAFTGDTLFVGSVGRPDLVGSLGQTAEDMAKTMYNTLQTKILTLPDDVQVRKGLTKMTFRWGRS